MNSLKECKYCKKLIPEDAEVCPHCGNDPEISRSKKFTLNFLLIMIAVSLAGLFFLNDPITKDGSVSNNADYEDSQEYSEDIGSYEYPEDNESDSENVENLDIGQVFSQNSVELTLTGASTWRDDEFSEEHPDPHTEYLMLNFKLANNSDREVSTFDFSFSGFADNKSVDRDFAGDHLLDATDLIPGSYAQGYVSFIVPDDWKEFKVRVEDYESDKIAVYSFTRDDVTQYHE